MHRRAFLASTLAATLVPQSLAAQSTERARRIGWVTAQTAASLAPYVEAFRQGLSERGYNEGQTLTIEYRYGEGIDGRVPELARELTRLPVDLIVAQGTAALELPPLDLPVVFVISADPVSSGFADSLAKPRGNKSGLTLMAVELNGKRLDLLKEIVPDLRRVAIVGNPEHPGAHLERGFSEETGRQLGLRIDYFPTETQDKLADSLARMADDPPQAISILADGFAIQNRKTIIDFAMSKHMPAISGWPIFAQSGALFTYGPKLTESYRRLAYYVDRILKGANPADLPIEQPTTFEFTINMRTAKTLNLTIPSSLLASADRVIE
ncbi:ABC transporter substrate-binding protein [Bradyrhizobium sp. Pear77]|uniref:ABC transporter substrate-binding protein n=1 Tax=Bradyrhizobium altum TaxID=1571202 RepID=UPI001E63BE51|nr:ABC transporter substrate-binding protein [Bradyrhizobium altum]MCC8953397.1 ABC transporter substrate-binding protein [Bradyrhizobium altum]